MLLRRHFLLEVLMWDGLEMQLAEGFSSRSLPATWMYNIHCWERKKWYEAGVIKRA